MILLVGHLGNMGKRYSAILKSMRVDFVCCDAKEPASASILNMCEIDRVIVATPTATHLRVLEQLEFYQDEKPIDVLCEKPITKRPEEFDRIRGLKHLRIYCVNQYAYLPEYDRFKGATGRTHYNYYRHGDDGIAWDCFQLFHLATGSVTLNETSPVWKCRINGIEINSAGMDMAYVQMVTDFLGPKKRVWDLFVTEVTTKRVAKWIAEEQTQE